MCIFNFDINNKNWSFIFFILLYEKGGKWDGENASFPAEKEAGKVKWNLFLESINPARPLSFHLLLRQGKKIMSNWEIKT